MARTKGSDKFRALGETGAALAKTLGVSTASIAKWRSGDNRPARVHQESIQARWPHIAVADWVAPVEARVIPVATEAPAGSLAAASDRLLELADKALRIASESLDEAEAEADPGVRAKLLRDFMGTAQALGKLTGEARELSDTQLVKMPAFRRLVDKIVAVLEPWPEAMKAVAEALASE
jgi:hypothetical protein